MMLAEKIIQLRKIRGWSQENLAEKMNVSRQAVSKWESCQASPDIEKILQLSKLFDVSTDYLLKDEEQKEFLFHQEKVVFPQTEKSPIIISMEEAKKFLNQQKQFSWKIALGVFLCITSPVILIILAGLSEIPQFGLSESSAAIIGLTFLFTFIVCGVALFLYCGFKGESFEFLEKNVPFDLENGIKDLVTERKNQFKSNYIKGNIFATCICIFSPMPIILSINSSDIIQVCMVSLTLLIVGFGVGIFIVVNTQNESMQKLLKEGEFTEKEKIRNELRGPVTGAYWLLIVSIHLMWSFLTKDWSISWLVYVVGGLLYPLVISLCNYISDKNSGRS